ncbi:MULTISPECIES: hypothetical protein [unclassified Streptomyces]|uniref:hypothetical protein n=1 Tax=unclassified Streptomyces TaxID=2593676 RepID=UPI0006FBC942|nr:MULTISPECIES: hypothetical protein [unclassified Streptomyces]KQX53102.1 hypothetical protein ASD33_07755 [Streptomyces sp. Root1304]KRA90023.1 hypothetical protein ASE09_07760 [Streptomyces sp. Root66D1]
MRRRPAAALLALLTLTATACGIQESDVVEAGGAATVAVAPIPEYRTVLYFLGPDGRSMPVARELSGPVPVATNPSDGTGTGEALHEEVTPEDKAAGIGLRPGEVATDMVLAMLLAGPVAAEATAGITTALPDGATAGGLHVTPDPSGPTSGRRLLRLRAPFPVMELSESAVRQLVCTTAYAEHPAGLVDVSVTGPDGALPVARCDD